MEKREFNQELAVANKVATLSLTVTDAIIALAYLIEGIKGNRTWGYVAIVVALALITPVVCWIIFGKQKDSPAIIHILSFGFAVLYCYVLFTAQNNLVFTYVYPMLMAVSVYSNLRYSKLLGTGVVVVNIIAVVITFVTKETGPEDIVSAEIQILLTILINVFLVLVSSTTERNGEARMAVIRGEKEKTDHLLSEILEVSGDMIKKVEDVSSQMDVLNDSMDQTLNSMKEVNSGTAESADAIQNQLVKTEEIVDYIGKVQKATSVINDNMDTTNSAVREGQEHIENLNRLTAASEQQGRDVAQALQTFQEYTSQMNSITDLITNVAEQTSLLALNASIEAARAGEAGRGFAVVASEIGSLANQTTGATENITALIENISGQLGTMVKNIEDLIESNEKQAESAETTSRSFATITENVREIERESADLLELVENLSVSNKAIVDSIQTVSAITEEVSAHSNETYSASQQNQAIVSEVGDLVEILIGDANRLQAATK
ncbi:MAG: hypothetical protein K6E92_07810 [Lachnospiraceae bacterium]|nr:hypothetical protein [Lachnospiraceae bacterium]